MTKHARSETPNKCTPKGEVPALVLDIPSTRNNSDMLKAAYQRRSNS